MWTDISVDIFDDRECEVDVDVVFNLFAELESEFTRFRPDSSLSLLNTDRFKIVSDRFIEVMHICKQLCQDTLWYFNPLVNLGQIGYAKSFDLKQFEKTNNMKVNLDFDTIEITGNTIQLRENQTLDLGGIVKWFAVDLARKYLNSKWYKNYIINAGGDIYTAGLSDQGKQIVVGIDSPFVKWNLTATITVQDKAVATSGTYKRKWTIDNQTYNHIVNPLTGENNNEITSITLIADDCYLADAYATVCIAMWLEKALAFLKAQKIEGIIICSDQKIYVTEWIATYNITIL